MSDIWWYNDLQKEILEIESVKETHTGEESLYIESVDYCNSVEFRKDISTFLLERDTEYSLDIRTKKNKDGFVAIVGNKIDSPINKVTMYCGKLGLSDRYTYQIQVKTADLVEDDVYDGNNPNAFALAVVEVLSAMFDFGPYDPEELSDDFEIKEQDLKRYISDIVEYIQK